MEEAYYTNFMGGGDFFPAEQKHQDVRVLSVTDTIETLTRLQERMKQPNTSHRMKKRVKGLQDLSLTLAMDDAASVPPEQVVALCQAVTKCFPKLQSLEICSEMDERANITTTNKSMEDESSGRLHLYELTSPQVFRFPIQALTVLLHPNKGLKKLRELTLDGLCLDADDDRMRLLVKAIEKHASLEQCYLYDTSMTTLVKTGRSGMEKLVGAVAKRCHKLVLVGCKLAPPSSASTTTRGKGCLWAGSCLVKLCRSTTLHEVKLHNLPDLREEHIVLMSQALGTNTSLRKLSILKLQELPRLPEEGDLPQKKKKMSLKRSDGSEEEELSSDAGTLALANMLRVNSTLEELCLSAVDFTEYSAMFLGNALEQDNCTLTDLWLMIPAHNGGTSSFPVDDKRIDYFLRLNRAGRKKFIKQPQCPLEQAQAEAQAAAPENAQDDRPEDSSSTTVNTDVAGICGEEDKKVEQRLEQIESLVHSKRDIDCSFYKLRNRPSLCEFLFGPDFNDS